MQNSKCKMNKFTSCRIFTTDFLADTDLGLSENDWYLYLPNSDTIVRDSHRLASQVGE